MKTYLLASAGVLALNPDLVYPVVLAAIAAGFVHRAHRRKDYA